MVECVVALVKLDGIREQIKNQLEQQDEKLNFVISELKNEMENRMMLKRPYFDGMTVEYNFHFHHFIRILKMLAFILVFQRISKMVVLRV